MCFKFIVLHIITYPEYETQLCCLLLFEVLIVCCYFSCNSPCSMSINCKTFPLNQLFLGISMVSWIFSRGQDLHSYNYVLFMTVHRTATVFHRAVEILLVCNLQLHCMHECCIKSLAETYGTFIYLWRQNSSNLSENLTLITIRNLSLTK